MILLSHKVAPLSRLNCTFIWILLYYYSIEKTILEAKREDESTLPKGQGLHHKNKFDPHSWSWDVTVDQNYKKYSHVSISVFWKLSTQNVAFEFLFFILAFSTNFCPIKIDMSGNTVWPQASCFQKLAKMDHFWHFCPLKM